MTTGYDGSSRPGFDYTAYLVRLWRDTAESPWHASAQSVQSGEIRRFGSVQALFAFLSQEIGLADEQEAGDCLGDVGDEGGRP